MASPGVDADLRTSHRRAAFLPDI